MSEGRGIAPDLFGDAIDARFHRSQFQRIVLEILEPDIPGVDVRQRKAQHPLPDRADQQGQVAFAWAVGRENAFGQVIVRSMEIDFPISQQRADNGERFLEPADPVIERESEWLEIGQIPAGTESEDETSVADLVDGRGLFRDDGRIVKRGARH